MNRKGFSLIELLAVLVILALLIVLVSGTVTNIINDAKVTVSEAQEQSILNAAEKWSVDNSQEFDDVEGKKLQISLDVVFVLDVSGSMDYNANKVMGTSGKKIHRAEAMAIAANSAMLDLYASNSDNRFGVAMYDSSGKTFMQFGHYSTVDNFITYKEETHTSCSRKMGTFYTGNVLKNGVSYSNTYKMTCGGTSMTTGLAIADNMFKSATDKKNRIPVLIILTDGDDDSAFNAIKKAMSVRETMESQYGSTVFVYTIGFAVSNNSVASLVLNPSDEAVDYAIKNKTAAKSLASNIKNSGRSYDYVDESFINALDTTALKNIFLQISGEIIEATRITQVCVTVQDLYEGGYLSKKDIDMASGEAASTYVIMDYNEATNQYRFNLAKTEKQIKDCKALLEEK